MCVLTGRWAISKRRRLGRWFLARRPPSLVADDTTSADPNDPTAHAEVEAIREACRVLGTFQLEECEIYSSSEPCPMCLGAIYWARPKAVYFANGRDVALAAGFDDDHIYEEFLLAPEERRYPATRLEIAGANEPFRRWAAKEDRVEY